VTKLSLGSGLWASRLAPLDPLTVGALLPGTPLTNLRLASANFPIDSSEGFLGSLPVRVLSNRSSCSGVSTGLLLIPFRRQVALGWLAGCPSFSRFVPASGLAAFGTLPWGCLPSSRHQPAVSLRRVPRPAAVRPRRFSRPRRFHPPPVFVGLFHPTATSRVRPTGCFPPTQP
jgi:hypothetical protein